METVGVKILYVAGELTGGGYQRQLYLLLSKLDREKISPALAVWRYDEKQAFADDINRLNIPIYSVSRQGGRFERQGRLNQIVRDVQPQYMHSYAFYTNFPTWLAARSFGVKGMIGSLRNNYWSEIADVGPLFGRLCASLPRLVIANSRAAASSVRNHRTFFRPRQVWVVSNSVDTETFRPNLSQLPVKVNGRVELLGVGRLTAQKRWGWLLSLLGELHQSGRISNWHFTLCGEGEEYASIKQQIEGLGLENQVTLVGHQKNIADWYRNSDILMLPSLFEGTPNVVAEALSSGIPVISTDVGDVRELVRDGLDGYITSMNDHVSFKKRLLELMQSPDLRRRMGQSGRNWMLQSRSAISLLEKTMNVYREAGWKIG